MENTGQQGQGQGQGPPGSLSWRLSSHPITLLTFLGFRIGPWFLAPCQPGAGD